MSDREKVNLLLVGRTGNGKSSTGNSILGRKVFKASMNSEPLTEADIILETRQDAQPQITVVDGPGIGDVSCNDPDGVQRTIDLADKATSLCGDGFDAVLLILKYGERFTTQEKDAVRMVKSILGSKVLEQHGVVVMTQGDNFETDQEKDGMSFKDWCGQQTGDFAGIVQECHNRCVLFDNRTKNNEKLDRQRQKLLECVYKCGPYTEQHYNNAEVDRRRLKLVSEFGIMEKANREIVDEITHEINKLDISKNPNAAKEKLTACESRLKKHRQGLLEKTGGMDVAQTLLFELDIVAGSLTNKLEMATLHLKLQEKAKHDGGEHDRKTKKKPRNQKGATPDKLKGNSAPTQSYQQIQRAPTQSYQQIQRAPTQSDQQIQRATTQSDQQIQRATTQSDQQIQTRSRSDNPTTVSDGRRPKSKTKSSGCLGFMKKRKQPK